MESRPLPNFLRFSGHLTLALFIRLVLFWFKVGFSIFSTWEKVYSRTITKKLRLDNQSFLNLSLKKWKEIMEATPRDKVEQIRRIDYNILASRARSSKPT